MDQFSGDWAAFMERIASMLRAGRDESSISSEFSGTLVSWKGKVLEKNLHEEYAQGVSLEMSPGVVALDHGRVLRGDYLFVNVSNEDGEEWRDTPVGAEVVFTAKISKTAGPFTEIQISEIEGEPELILMVGLYQGRPA